MRSIQITTDVFARIWANRIEGEEDENAILSRLLGVDNRARGEPSLQDGIPENSPPEKVRWRDDVRAALLSLGGQATLKALYDQVRKIRLENGRSVPVNLAAIVRRELEFNSSDSHAFTGNHDWFKSLTGIGGGQWGIRDGER